MLYTNPAFLSRLGYTNEEAQSLNLADIFADGEATPESILARLQSELPAVRNDPGMQQRAAGASIIMLVTADDVLRARMESEVPRWKQIIPELGLKVE